MIMHFYRCRSPVLWAVSLLCCLTVCMPAGAQSVSGSAINRSRWDNFTMPPPPGDGSNTGDLRVGIWPGQGELIGLPLTSVLVIAADPLPLPYDSSYAFNIIGPLAPGDYRLVAWIDGNGSAALNLGEPRSQAVAFSIEDQDIGGVNVIVVDDSVGNGMADWWEMRWFGEVGAVDPNGDADNDGLTNREEYEIAMSHPSLIDLSPVNWDTSGDGMDDWWKWQYYRGGAGLHPCVFEAHEDPDGDGLTNLQEYRGTDGFPRMEQDPNAEPGVGRLTGSNNWLDPLDIDTSGDGLIDSFALAWYDPGNGIDPRVAGDPGADPDSDGLTNFREQCLHAPLSQGGANDLWSNGPAGLPARNPVTGIRAFNPPLNLINWTAGLVELIDVVYVLRDHASWTRPSNGSGYWFDAPHLNLPWSIALRPGWDTDGDLLPDGWEVEFGLDPRDGDILVMDGGLLVPNPNSFLGDPDGDGLVNIQEYTGQDGKRAEVYPYIRGSGDETNPNQHAWWPNLVQPRPLHFPSVNSFLLANRQHPGGLVAGSLPTIPLGFTPGYDTDDNGIPDLIEIQSGHSPVHSMDPFVMRGARILAADGIVIPDPLGSPVAGYRPDLITRAWTLECYVRIGQAGRSGDLIVLPGPADDHGALMAYTARLSLDDDKPVVAFQTIAGNEYLVTGLPLPPGYWVHLAGVWSPDDNALTLYVDGVSVQSLRVDQEAASQFQYAMRSEPRLAVSEDGGHGFAGQLHIDEVRIWGNARTAGEIETYRRELVDPGQTGLRAYFRFDDGGSAAEDFTRRARSSLKEGIDYLFADRGYALTAAGAFDFDPDDFGLVYGLDFQGADDSSGDGLPDPWKTVNHFDPFSDEGDGGRYGDPDGDGVWNIYEYWAGTNPREADSFGDGILDADRDIDGDGLTLIQEQRRGTHPRLPDTADNGLLDGDPRDPVPANSVMPLTDRVLRLDGSADSYVQMPNRAGLALTSWTLQAWVMPMDVAAGGTLLARRMRNDVVNYELSVSPGTGHPRVRFTSADRTQDYELNSPAPLPPEQWTHVAATFDETDGRLRLLIDGQVVDMLQADRRPARNGIGPVELRIGEGWNGYLDEVAVFGRARSAGQIAASMPGLALQTDVQDMALFYRFDDGTSAVGPAADGRWYGTSGNPEWWWGQVEDFAPGYENDWMKQWRNAGTLAGNAVMVSRDEDPAMPEPSPVNYADTDSNDDGIPDWWYVRYGYDPNGPSIAEEDPDGDGISNYWEYRLGSDPLDAYSLDPERLLTDGEWDSDGDGLSNWDEIHYYGTDPTLWDTDDDGYGDGDEVSDAFVDLNYGFSMLSTDPLHARGPLIRRSLILDGNHLAAPFGERFSMIPDEDSGSDGPVVAITRPDEGSTVNVRFVEIAGTVQSERAVQSVQVYNNGLFVQNVTLAGAGAFEVTVILVVGDNVLEVLAVDEDGAAGRASVTVIGDFARADIRVTQTWDVPGDLDTWLVDPQGRHMGWTAAGPGLPENVAAQIPGAFLDIDDIPGTGPENITVEQGQAINGEYQVWMNNFSHQGDPQSTVRVLVLDGLEGQQYVEFGPQSMPVSDNNGANPDAWWHVTTISWPSGAMNPAGRPVSTEPDGGDPGDGPSGEITLPGWTIEAWIKPMDDVQSGAVASYRLPDGRLPYVVGLSNNHPVARIRSMGGTVYELTADPLPSGEWTHLAFVYGEDEAMMRLFTNGVETASRSMPLPPLKGVGEMTVDAGWLFAGGDTRVFDAAFLDELRFWSRARGPGAIAANMHRHVDPAPSLLAYYYFDDGGLGIEDGTQPLDRAYDLGGWPLPDEMTDAKPGPDGIWGTADDIPADPGPGMGDGHNDYVTATDHAPAVFANLRVMIEPEGAVLAGAEWRIGSGSWQAPGVTLSNLNLGVYRVGFRTVAPWTTPDGLSINLAAAGTVVVTGRYTHASGVQIFIQPPEAVVAGAAWRWAGEDIWHNHADIVERPAGTYTVIFRDLDGWMTPGELTAVVEANTISTYTRSYFMLNTIGEPGAELPGQFNFPRGMALDADRNLYVADSGNHRIQVRDPVSGAWTVLGSAGSGAGQFQQPFGLAVDGSGRLYVADANNHRIQRYNPAGGDWTVWGGPDLGGEPGQFRGPFDVAVDAQNNVYVADHYNHRVQKRTADGVWIVLIGSGFENHQTRLPSGLAIDGDHLILADHVTGADTVSRVRRFSTQGVYLETLPGSADGVPLAKPRSPFLSPAGNLLLADMVNHRILIFNPVLNRWDVAMDGTTLREPEGVAMDQPGFIYVSDTANHRVLRLGMSGYSGQSMTPYSIAMPSRTLAAEGGRGFVIRWQGRSGWLYTVEYRDSLRNDGYWQPLPGADRIEGIDGLMEAVDPDAFSQPTRFYRVLAF